MNPTKKQQQTTLKAEELRKAAKNDDDFTQQIGLAKKTMYKRLKDSKWGKGDMALIDNLYSFVNIKNNYNLPLPTSQNQEVLFELINRNFIDRPMMMNNNNIWNLTAIISELRNNPLLRTNIVSNEFTGRNKYNREISFVNYSLKDKDKAIELYLIMTKQTDC